MSETAELLCGVPQGSVFGSILFLLYKNSKFQQKIIAGDFGKKNWPATWLAVLLIPRMHDPYNLYLVVKVTNQAFQ